MEKKKLKLEYKFNKTISTILIFSKNNIIEDKDLLFEVDTLKRRISLINNTEPNIIIEQSINILWDNKDYIRNKNIDKIFNKLEDKIKNKNDYKKIFNILKPIINKTSNEYKEIIWKHLNILLDIIMLWTAVNNNDIDLYNKIYEKKKYLINYNI